MAEVMGYVKNFGWLASTISKIKFLAIHNPGPIFKVVSHKALCLTCTDIVVMKGHWLEFFNQAEVVNLLCALVYSQ